MAPELIAQVLNNACQDDKLNFQIVLQESILHIYINREIDSELDYTQLVNDITDSLITLDKSWEGFWLYSRVMGEVEPDWQTYVDLQVDLSDKKADFLIEQAEDLINEAKESLKDLKYLQNKDVLALEELDDAILNKNSFLLIMESAEEVDNSQGEIAEEELEDLFVVEELDDSVLDKDSHLLAEESAEEVDNSQGEIVEEELESLFLVEELDDSVLDKDSHLLAEESAEEVDNSQGEVAEEELESLFLVEELDDKIAAQESNSLEIESNNIENNSDQEIEEEDIFAIEESDQEIINKEPETLEIDSNEKIVNLEPASNEILNFSEYCFIRNQGLLNSDLVAPKLNIAHLISFFHDLPQENKFLLLSILNQHFKLQEVISKTQKEQLSPEIQDWLQQIITLNSEQTRKAAIWFSRYCFDIEKTMSEIQQVFDAEALKQAAKKQEEKKSVSTDNEKNKNQELESAPTDNKNNQDNQDNQDKEQLIKSLLPDVPKSNVPQKSQTIERETEKKQFSQYNMNLIVPIICLIVTFLFVILGVSLINSNSVDTEEQQSLLQKYYF